MKFRAFHLYFIFVLITGLIGAYIDLTSSYQSIDYPYLNGTVGFFYTMGITAPIGGIVLLVYYMIVYLYRKKKVKKSYI